MSQKKNSPTAIDLFSGCGGLSLGLKQAGFKVIGAVEIDPVAVKTYRLNHRKVKIWQSDIKKISVSSVMRALKLKKGELDILAGCPPCQGFSSIRTHNGGLEIVDERNDLVFEFLRFVKKLRPKVIMMENVPGLDSDERIEIFCRRLERMGYTWERRVLNAANYGVPQRRRRMILLGSRFGKVNFASEDKHRYTVKEAIEALPVPGQSGDPLHDLPESRTEKVMKLIREIPKDGGSRTDLDESWQLDCHKRHEGFNDIYGRMAWNEVSPTITGGCTNPSKGRFLHPEQDRAITLREAALLQSFPLKYRFSLEKGKGGVMIMIGNALPPKFIKRHAIEVRRHLLLAA
jgi:DNA (cytosine-5)-methyltransferase 1